MQESGIPQYFLNFSARKWKIGDVASLSYIILDGVHDINVDMSEILSSLNGCKVEHCMDIPLIFHIKEFYAYDIK